MSRSHELDTSDMVYLEDDGTKPPPGELKLMNANNGTYMLVDPEMLYPGLKPKSCPQCGWDDYIQLLYLDGRYAVWCPICMGRGPTRLGIVGSIWAWNSKHWRRDDFWFWLVNTVVKALENRCYG